MPLFEWKSQLRQGLLQIMIMILKIMDICQVHKEIDNISV